MRSERKKKKKRWVKILLTTLLVIILGVGAYAFTVYNSLTSALDSMHSPIDRDKSDKRAEEVTLEKKQPFSILMLGVDEREGDRGRSDTMIVLTVNPNLNSIKMLSIPRDTRTEIVGRGTTDKINHAYAFGKEEMAMATVENFLDIPIDYVVKVNMEGFEDIVNAVGGISVDNAFSFSEEGHQFNQGQITLDGEEALAYVRMRKQDPSGDFGRQQRQRQVIKGVIDQGASFNSLTNFDSIFSALGNNVKTSMTFDEMVEIQKNYKDAAKNIEQIQLTGTGSTIDGIYYLVVPQEEKVKVQDLLKSHLEI
ncbi:polyisoprenyl-teichoic acid--peptidoglycan teichoic acid transferase TagU [Robertmurraya korlensis]|uniref:polyisoprenyl-teichoic acid--peptidoglycan teichoic acid transferase TagU n=1 Tax=Robertmurraya korlensis TaxID=519977 RepID=UPI0008269C9B|nr:LytR family transcriptional regulator [Robertmurraya korlensis]